MAIESATPTASLAPGFRFHPTDEELVRYYLKRKICGKPFRFDAISDIDVYKCEPWDLPGQSRLKSRDLEWYFFSVLDKKYGNGSRTNRATEKGYWKTTGKDRTVLHRSRTVGMKKTLVYHSGRAPRGERTNWVMHEYRLVDEELEKAGIVQDAFVLCRIFQKSGSGPKNGEQYGAPFIEEEWEDNELVMVPGEEAAEELVVSEGAYLDGHDLEQILDSCIPTEDATLHSNYYYGDNSNYVEESTEFKDDAQKLLVGMGENHFGIEQPDGQNLFDLSSQYDVDAKTVKHEYIGEPSNTMNPEDTDYLLDEPFLDAIENPPFDGAFLETNDLSNPIEADPSGFDWLGENLTFYNAVDDETHYIASDSSKRIGNGNLVSDQASFIEKNVKNGDQVAMASQQLLKGQNNYVASSSNLEPAEYNPDIEGPLIKQAKHMLGSIPAAPAFASEFPSKDVALRPNSASQSSNSVHVTAGMIQIRNLTLSGNGTDWLFGKHGDANVTLSFGLSQNNPSSLEPISVLSSKAGSAMSRGWLYLMFIWVLILSISFKIGAYIYTGKAC